MMLDFLSIFSLMSVLLFSSWFFFFSLLKVDSKIFSSVTYNLFRQMIFIIYAYIYFIFFETRSYHAVKAGLKLAL